MKPSTAWRTRPISPTCEVAYKGEKETCGLATSYAYPAMGGGWMSLCDKHAAKHLPNGCTPIEQLIRAGERFE